MITLKCSRFNTLIETVSGFSDVQQKWHVFMNLFTCSLCWFGLHSLWCWQWLVSSLHYFLSNLTHNVTLNTINERDTRWHTVGLSGQADLRLLVTDWSICTRIHLRWLRASAYFSNVFHQHGFSMFVLSSWRK